MTAKIPKEQLLETLRQVADKLGHPPTTSEYRAHKTAEQPSDGAIWRRFSKAENAWLTALYFAGLDPSPGRHGGRGSSDNACLLGLRLAAAELQEWPSPDQYRAVDGSPSVQTVYERFGSWETAREWCANQTWQGRPMMRKFPAGWDQFLTHVFQWAAAENESLNLTKDTYRNLRPSQPDRYGWPTAVTIMSHFETWNKAKETAGCPTRGNHNVEKIPKEDAVEAVTTVFPRVSGTLTQLKYEDHRDHDHPSAWQITKRYGWTQTKRWAGVTDKRIPAACTPITEQTAIRSLREVAARSDDVLTMQRYNELRDGDVHPSAHAIAKKFKWNDVKEMAGLDTRPQVGEQSPITLSNLSTTDAIEFLKTVAQRVDGPLTMEQYDECRDDEHPAAGTLSRDFGWNELKEKAGLEASQTGRTSISKEAAIEALQVVVQRVDRSLTCQQYDDYRDEEHPTANTLATKFGWNDLKEEAGLDTTLSRLEREEVIETLQTVDERVNEPLSIAQYNEHRDADHPNGGALARKFGWNALKKEAGLM